MNFFQILVGDGFGSVFLAVLAVALFFFIYGAIMKIGPLTTTAIAILYMAATLTIFYGAAVGIIMFTGSAIYIIASISPWISEKLSR